jgi:hypothetical protein
MRKFFFFIVLLTVLECSANDTLISHAIPTWVEETILKNKVVLSAEEKSTMSLLDLNGDRIMDALFVRNQDLVFIDEKGHCRILNDIIHEDGEILNDFSWVDYIEVKPQMNKKVYPYLKSKGQVLVLIKETSGAAYIYYFKGKFRYTTSD